jgi:hypothetical protein
MVTTKMSVTCGSSPEAFIQVPSLDGTVVVTATLDIGACKITQSNIDIRGAVGGLLSGLPETQEFVRSWAQIRLSNLCGM